MVVVVVGLETNNVNSKINTDDSVSVDERFTEREMDGSTTVVYCV